MYDDGRGTGRTTGRVDAYSVFAHVACYQSERIVGTHIGFGSERYLAYVFQALNAVWRDAVLLEHFLVIRGMGSDAYCFL